MSTSFQNALVPNTGYSAPSGTFYTSDSKGIVTLTDTNLKKDQAFFVALGFQIVGGIPTGGLPAVTSAGTLATTAAALSSQSYSIINSKSGVYIVFSATWSDTGAEASMITAPSTVSDANNTYSIVSSVMTVKDDTGVTVYLPTYANSAAANSFITGSGSTNGHLTVRAIYALTS